MRSAAAAASDCESGSSESDWTVQSQALDSVGLLEIGAGAGGDTSALAEVGEDAVSLRAAASRRRCCNLDDEPPLALLLLRLVDCGNGGRAFCASAGKGEGDLDDAALLCGERSSGILSNWSEIFSEPQAEDSMPRKLLAFAAIELRLEAAEVDEDLCIEGRGGYTDEEALV